MAVCECSAWVLALLCWDVLCHQEHGSCTGTVGVQLGVRVVEVITSPGYQQMKKMSCCPQSAQPPLLAASVVEDEVRGRAYSQLQILAESSVPTGNQVEEVKAQRHQLGEWLRLSPYLPGLFWSTQSPRAFSSASGSSSSCQSQGAHTGSPALFELRAQVASRWQNGAAEVHCPLGAVCATSQQPALTEG